MKSLQIQYSKEVARELGKIAIYLPGEEVEVGDILSFPFGKRGLFQKAAPLGSFQKITSLKNLGIYSMPIQKSKTPDSYRFTSKQAVNFQLNTGVQADFGNEAFPQGKGELHISLSAEGAICFFALHCYKTSLEDITALENEINTRGKKMVWEDTFLVTSVTIAKKALIIQSNSEQSEITLGGDVQGLQSGSLGTLKASAKIHISKQKGDLLIKDWSDEVTVFMDLMKFEKETFDVAYKKEAFIHEDVKTTPLKLVPVSVSEILEEHTH